MTRAIVAQKKSLPMPSRTEVGYAEDLADGELELHILSPTTSDERLIVEKAGAARRDRPRRPPPLDVNLIIRLKISHQALHQLEGMVATGLYGANVNEAAREMLYLQLRREQPLPRYARKPQRKRGGRR